MNYAIVSKKDEKSHQVELKIQDTLNKNGWIYNKQHPKLVICVGGDGTLLYAVHKYSHCLDEIDFLGIHTGTLGFFTDYTEDELEDCLKDLLHKKPTIVESGLLKVLLDNDPEPKYALNEIRIENIEKSQNLDIYIDNEFFETCRGSGVCVSTQAGSTAYSRGLGGAVIDDGISLMQLTEIIPIQHSKHRSLGSPYIMMDSRIIHLKSDDFTTAHLCYDHLNMPLNGTNEIICQMAEHKVRFARYREYSYLKRLKNLY